MRTLVHCLAVVCVAAGGVITPAFGQTADRPSTSTAANPIPDRATVPPLHLSDAQREQVRAALRNENSAVSFDFKDSKKAKSFQPGIGAKLPKGVTPHPLPQALTEHVPILKEFKYVKFKDDVLVINPMTIEIVDMFSQS